MDRERPCMVVCVCRSPFGSAASSISFQQLLGRFAQLKGCHRCPVVCVLESPISRVCRLASAAHGN